MLIRLVISNYALIRDLQVEFGPGFNIITGETGAGKSILLGALGLILGNRADLLTLRDKNSKCIVEGAFSVADYGFEPFFTENDLDFETVTLLRREITPSGKSRAFINDTPVNLNLLRELGIRLIDIHSQHQNLDLAGNHFQLKLIDIVAGNLKHLQDYEEKFKRYNKTSSYLAELKDLAEKSKDDLDYYSFQFNQLHDAKLQDNEQEELEKELEKLTHAEEIKKVLSDVSSSMEDERYSPVPQTRENSRKLSRIKDYLPEAELLSARLESSYLELRDIADEVKSIADKIEHDPFRIGQINERLGIIYTLEQKHHVTNVGDLIRIKESFLRKISEAEGYGDEILKMEKQLEENLADLKASADNLSANRTVIFGLIREKVESMLHQLGIPDARFMIRHNRSEEYSATGTDQIQFLFSANKDTEVNDISRIASGGEMSRLMLAIKTLVAGSRMLPTIIFDEIDSGISGEISFKMAAILKELSSNLQVINITHLPQIAGRGDTHYVVYKDENEQGTYTSIKKLSENERIEEIAKMVSGDQLSDSSLKTARELLSRN